MKTFAWRKNQCLETELCPLQIYTWQPTPVFLPGESHGQRSLVGYSPWGHTESGKCLHVTWHSQKKKVIVFLERLWVLVQKKTRQGGGEVLSLAHSRCSVNIWERNSAERMSPSLIGLLCLNYSAHSEMWESHLCLLLSLPLSQVLSSTRTGTA